MKSLLLVFLLITGMVKAAEITEDQFILSGATGSASDIIYQFGDTRQLKAGRTGTGSIQAAFDGSTFYDLIIGGEAQTIGGVKTFSDLPIFSVGIDVNGNSTVDGTLDVTGNTTVTGSLDVSSTTLASKPYPSMSEAQRDLLTPASGDIIFNTDTEKVNVYSLGTWGEVGGGGGGGLDVYHTNDFEADNAADLSTGNNTSFLGGGTIQGTLADETVAPLSDAASIKYTQAAGSLNDYFTLDTGNIALDKRQRERFNVISFQYTYDGADDDLKVVVYDVTNATVLTDSTDTLEACDLEACTFNVGFYTASNTASLRVGIQVAVENSGKILIIDDVELNDNGVLITNLIEENDFYGYFDGSAGASVSVVRENVTGTFSVSRSATGIYTVDYSSLGLTVIPNIEATATGATDSNDRFLTVPRDTLTTSEAEIVIKNSGGVAQDEDFFITISLQGADYNPVTEHIVTPAKSGIEEYKADGHAGYGSTATKIPYYTNVRQNTISSLGAITNDSTNGWIFTASKKVTGIVSAAANYTSANGQLGFSINSNQLTTDIASIDEDDLKGFVNVNGANESQSHSVPFVMNAGDTLRVHTSNAGTSFADTHTVSLVVYSFEQMINSAIPVQRVAYVKDVKPTNTQGGTCTSGAWRTRVLNDVSGDSEIVNLSSNQLTLNKGKYKIKWSAPVSNVDGHKSKLYNITDSINEIISGEGNAGSTININEYSHGNGVIEISSTKTFEIQHDCQTTASTTGFGRRSDSTGEAEASIYTQVEITKLK